MFFISVADPCLFSDFHDCGENEQCRNGNSSGYFECECIDGFEEDEGGVCQGKQFSLKMQEICLHFVLFCQTFSCIINIIICNFLKPSIGMSQVLFFCDKYG